MSRSVLDPLWSVIIHFLLHSFNHYLFDFLPLYLIGCCPLKIEFFLMVANLCLVVDQLGFLEQCQQVVEMSIRHDWY